MENKIRHVFVVLFLVMLFASCSFVPPAALSVAITQSIGYSEIAKKIEQENVRVYQTNGESVLVCYIEGITPHVNDQIIYLPYEPLDIQHVYHIDKYMVITDEGKLEYLLIDHNGIGYKESILSAHSFTSFSTHFGQNNTIRVLALEENGDVWLLEFANWLSEWARPSIDTWHIDTMTKVSAVMAGDLNLALASDGRIYQWGTNTAVSSNENIRMPMSVIVPELTDCLPVITEMESDLDTMYLLDENGNIWLKGMDKYGLCESEASKYHGELVSPGLVWYYPIYDWTMLPRYNDVRSIRILSNSCMRIETEQDVSYHRVTSDINNVSAGEQYDINEAYLRDNSGGYSIFEPQDIPKDFRELYEHRRETPLVGENIIDYWGDDATQISLKHNGDVHIERNDGTNTVRRIPYGQCIVYNPYVGDVYILIVDVNQDLWRIDLLQ